MLSLEFTAFDIEDHKKCDHDYFYIMDENKTDLMDLSEECGSSLPNPIRTKTNIVDLFFVSDKTIQKTGWNLTWTTEEHIKCSCVDHPSRFFYSYLLNRPTRCFIGPMCTWDLISG